MPRGSPVVGKYASMMPNIGSPHATPSSIAIDLHYAKLGLVQRWNWERYIRLCSFLNLTPHELGSIICISHKHVENFEHTNRLERAEVLLLTMLECHVCKDHTSDVIENPLPDLKTCA